MIKVAFVGCGGIQAVHQKNVSKLDRVKIVGHCDILPDRAEARAAQYGGEAFTEFEAMYDKAKPHAVFIAVPPYAHVGMEEAAAQRGIHLFIEKPIAIDYDMAKRIAAAIQSAKIVCSVAYCFRYYDTVALARKILKGKAVSLITGTWNGGMPGVWWWRQMDKSGGQIVEQTTHMFDLARYLCGDVAEVHSVASTGCMTKVENFDVHDSSVVSLRMKSGAISSFTSSCVANNGAHVGLQIITPEATMRFQGGKLTVIEDGRTTEYSSKVDMYAEESRVFIDAVRSGKKNKIRSSYADALKTFLVTWAANESIRTGMPVKP
ncbi:MAG: Gfo/Idh/MocA family oxidoreductase [Candidatus Hydrogenedentes bacterium]|nr:Gfo/Idh/MocA family oxidoreductase [Candidatus Hydrogenedentota bacterium]